MPLSFPRFGNFLLLSCFLRFLETCAPLPRLGRAPCRPAWAKSGRPPPLPPRMVATSETILPALKPRFTSDGEKAETMETLSRPWGDTRRRAVLPSRPLIFSAIDLSDAGDILGNTWAITILSPMALAPAISSSTFNRASFSSKAASCFSLCFSSFCMRSIWAPSSAGCTFKRELASPRYLSWSLI